MITTKTIMTLLLPFWLLVACTPDVEVVQVTRPIVVTETKTAVPITHTPTAEVITVEVTRVVVTLEPTATPTPCTPLPEGVRLTISMAEENRVMLDVEGLLPEDRLTILLNSRSSAYTQQLSNPLGPGGRFQDSFYLGEPDDVIWTGQIIHQRGAVCFEFTLPLTEPIVIEALASSPNNADAPESAGASVTAVPESTELMNPVAAAANITMGPWSPDSRYFIYWARRPENAPSTLLEAGSFHIYDTEREQTCPFGGYRLDLPTWNHTYLWLPDGNLLLHGEPDITVVQPCSDFFTILADRFPEPITNLVAWTPDYSTLLFANQNSFWLYQYEGHQVQSVTGFDPELEDGAAFSPDGRFVALNGDEGDSYLLDVNTATVSHIATWQKPLGLGGQANPEWLNNTQFVVRSSNDLGPLLIDVDGTAQNIGQTFFGQATGSDSAVFVHKAEGNDRFHLRIESFSSEADFMRLYHSETGEHELISLAEAKWFYTAFPANAQWLLIHASTEGNQKELWVRPLDPANSAPWRVAAHDESITLRLAPVGNRLAVATDNRIELINLANGTTLASYAATGQTLTPGSFSPDGRFLAVIGNKPNGAETLFILPVDQQ